MKRIIILAVALFVAVSFNADAKREYHGVGGYFYTELAPYGSWIEVDYGVVVWRPTIIRLNWGPYQMGRWVWTYDGWYWDSYEPFGYITYHYGRWYFDDYYGWLWYPDYDWAPAWVEWRYDNDYIGWAPLNPYAVFSVAVGIYFTTNYSTPYSHWNYVTYGNFCDPYVYNYYIAPGSKYRVHTGTKYRNNYTYYNGRVQNRGIDIEYVRVHSGKEIRQRDLIRTNDSRELKRDGYKEQDQIRTLDMSRDQLTRNDLIRMEIKHENRTTSLKMEKVEIGDRMNSISRVTKDKSTDRNFSNRNSVNKSNGNTIDIKSDKRETNQIKKSNNMQKDDKEVSVRNENQQKKQDQVKKVKKQNVRLMNNDKSDQQNVNDKNKTNERNQNSDRVKENINTQERKRK